MGKWSELLFAGDGDSQLALDIVRILSRGIEIGSNPDAQSIGVVEPREPAFHVLKGVAHGR